MTTDYVRQHVTRAIFAVPEDRVASHIPGPEFVPPDGVESGPGFEIARAWLVAEGFYEIEFEGDDDGEQMLLGRHTDELVYVRLSRLTESFRPQVDITVLPVPVVDLKYLLGAPLPSEGDELDAA